MRRDHYRAMQRRRFQHFSEAAFATILNPEIPEAGKLALALIWFKRLCVGEANWARIIREFPPGGQFP